MIIKVCFVLIIIHIHLVPNKIVLPLLTKSFCNINKSFIFDLKVSNPKTGVNWTINENILDAYVGKVEKHRLGHGHHQLILKKCTEDLVGVITATTRRNVKDEILTSQSILKIGKKILVLKIVLSLRLKDFRL